MNKNNETDSSQNSGNINWLITIYLNPITNPYKQTLCKDFDLAYFH